ncbi:MAG: LuxR C-terminal-related transcriptional regulator [Clostridia bacterium]|nr:LuxR C-terminal-related transcriptional regulator [Clostridia bacterium]
MKHVALLFYVISLMTGIGLMTVAGIYYLKTKSSNVKYLIYGELFFTFYLFIDITSFYSEVIQTFFIPVVILCISGFLVASAGAVYYLMLLAYGLIGNELSKTKRRNYLMITFSILAIFLTTVLLLYKFRWIGFGLFGHTITTYASTFSAVGGMHIIFILASNRKRIPVKARKAVIGCLLVLFVCLPVAVLLNIIEYKVDIEFPTAFSPIIYFFMNAIMLLYARKHYIYQMTKAVDDTADPVQPDFSELSKSFGLTDREYQIALLVIEGCNNKEIGEKLFISPHTVRNHVYNMYKKIGVKNRIELIQIVNPIRSSSIIENSSNSI